MQTLTKCPSCGHESVKTKAVFMRPLDAQLKPKGETETFLEQECQYCGWVQSLESVKR